MGGYFPETVFIHLSQVLNTEHPIKGKTPLP